MGQLTSGYRFCQFFVKEFFEKMSSVSDMQNAIISGEVYCHCDIDRMDAEPHHSVGCLWGRYVDEIYRIGRIEDGAQDTESPEVAVALRQRGAVLSRENLRREAAHRNR